MARGGHSPNPAALPKVEFVKVQDEVSAGGPPGVQDGQARSFGYNDGYPYTRPELYIRHIEPLEIDLARQVEYDMDEQDEEWLEAVNAERKKEHLDRISAETFEIIMDRVEKEWFDLTKNLPKSDLAMPSEDSTCAVCDDSEGENSNAIVFCDGCNLAVHQDCYGVPYIPEGQWLCRKCTVSPENPVQCYLCPNEGGAFKQTIHGEWVHLLCAMWVPETRVANDVFMEPITGIEKISKQRWKLRCSICDIREGACIQCAKSSCFVAFHATCARQEKLLLPMKTTQGAESAVLQAFCERHLPEEQQNIRAAALAAEAEQGDNKHSSKAARAYNKTYKPGPPIVPAIIVNRISQYIQRINIRKKVELVQLICRYWSLKREARRGAPLLKRLHLEPWTAGGGKIQTIEEKRMKLEQLQALRRDLTYVKMLTLLVKFRELRKLRQTEIVHQVLSLALYPHEAALRMALETIMAADKQDFFKNPVNKNEVPDYFDIVLNPMCWSMIEDRLDKHEYWDVQTFKNDIDLVIDNAILYNPIGTRFYKAALRIRSVSQPALQKLEALALPAESIPRQPESDGESSGLPLIGDLESPLELLEILHSSDLINDGLNLELGGNDPITSLVNMELAQYKPPPIIPPSPELAPKIVSKKKKRDKKAVAEKAKAKKAAALASKSQTPAPLPVLDSKGMQHAQGQLEVEANAGANVAGVTFEKQAYRRAERGETAGPSTTRSLEGEVEAGPSKPRKRSSMTLPPITIPRVVEDVDNQGSFQLFNSGWILPPETKRHGRTPVDKASIPPPKKRQKTDHQLSRRASAASEVQPTTSPVDDAQDVPSGPPATAIDDPGNMEVDPFNLPPGTPFPDNGVKRMSVDASGRVVIEELDTPYTRRQKSYKRKAEKRKAVEPGEEQSLPEADIGESSGQIVVEAEAIEQPISAVESTPVEAVPPSIPSTAPVSEAAGPSTRRGHRKVSIEVPEDAAVTDSELSELSEATAGEAGTSAGKSQPNSPSKKPTDMRKKKNQRALEHYESGTLVWAKSDSYPWWPAVVFDADHADIPANVLTRFKNARRQKKKKEKLYIVRFYDNNNLWAFLPRDKLKELGEDKSLDADMLALASINQKWKSKAMRTNCRLAYRIACGEMETETADEEAAEALAEDVLHQADSGSKS